MTAACVLTPLWWDPSAGGVDVHAGPARPPLRGDLSVDVAVVGAGYTGLWTAYYLARLDPSLRVAVLEREVAGFGASGRNGGWCSALFPVPPDALARRAGREAAVAMHRAARDAVEEVGRVADAEGIDCAFSRGGTVSLARNRAQLRRARHEVDTERRFGLDGHVLLSAREAADRCGATRVLGGTYTPHCAALHPARLVRGLAAAVERRGVTVYEGTPVTALGPGRAVTPHGTVRAEVVVRATEGYTAGLPGLRRALLPVYSLMVATEPLPEAFWSATGLARRETFADHRRLVIYGQRTADDRLAFGGRGAPYHWASSVRPAHDHVPAVAAALRRTLEDLFPALRPVRPTHAWGGPLGVPRDWHPSVGLDRAGGTAWAGGYVGDGVAASNLAGRTLADLITGTDSALVRLPWVGHRSRRWEPEPLRWVGVNTARLLVSAADRLADGPTRPRGT
ncbi:MAG: Glycine/D-amino acid oxidases (deaminating) [uncultured Pseudonocardia sp.]|uniref:Glycine/D-amino acid oxidases (Deaminating) n=1 Tax=uncultured Pseudonocardia sp. TaxID=211455 RepID=A0A6J4PBZ3_9PSEU|nr:MAG: Glycine/D-amino acid oxidases (deaminating) [uncultured Pseudonocardia sp.]